VVERLTVRRFDDLAVRRFRNVTHVVEAGDWMYQVLGDSQQDRTILERSQYNHSLMADQYLAGINIVTYYAPTLFQSSLGMSQHTALLLGALLQVWYVAASFVTVRPALTL